eukprot:6974823-Pyramimonas_sp.AAC.1
MSPSSAHILWVGVLARGRLEVLRVPALRRGRCRREASRRERERERGSEVGNGCMPASKLAITPRNASSTRHAREDHRSDHRDDSINDPACAPVPDLMLLAGLPPL